MLLKVYGACARDGRVVAIEGEAGVGKTRLAEDLLAAVQEQGGKTLTARCYEGETGLAYAPIVALSRAAVRQLTQNGDLRSLAPYVRREIARLLPEASDLRDDLMPITPLDTPAAQARFLDGITSVIFAACAERGHDKMAATRTASVRRDTMRPDIWVPQATGVLNPGPRLCPRASSL